MNNIRELEKNSGYVGWLFTNKQKYKKTDSDWSMVNKINVIVYFNWLLNQSSVITLTLRRTPLIKSFQLFISKEAK